jgi:hypothetical protein
MIALASLVRNLELRMAPWQSVWQQHGIVLRQRDPLLITAKARPIADAAAAVLAAVDARGQGR